MDQHKHFDIAFDTEKQCFIFCIYDSQGTLCKYSILDDKTSLQVAKYQDIKVDLEQAQKAVDELINIDSSETALSSETIKNALFDYVIILIVKCFNSSTGRKTSLDFKKIFKENRKLLDLYKKILKIRNEQIAHSGDYMNSLVLYFDPKTKNPIDLRYSHIKRLSGEQIITYKELTQLISYIIEEVKKIKDKLYMKLTNELKEKGALFYYSSARIIDKSTIVTTIEIDGKLKAKSFMEN
jgi:hypothetical protein